MDLCVHHWFFTSIVFPPASYKSPLFYKLVYIIPSIYDTDVVVAFSKIKLDN